MKTISEIGEFFRSERLQRDLKLEEMAKRTGLTQVTLRGLLNGQNDSRLSTVLAVAQELGLELALVPAGVAKSVQQRERSGAVESLVSKALRGQSKTPDLASDRGGTRSDILDKFSEPVSRYVGPKF
ncbi:MULTISPECIES: helix-turn-helix domain-containing protein [unclassified Janthinobacterium]|uniref:helix-turn-helix domain-containing protein n=1 Tax=unclassified Janthinobacterium TaxID=2610881 RepID=UPI0016157A29|nr:MULTISPECIES: helix-turn-helix transcriptional regulator [unclassified Janthinobacterium]MBB5609483.1 transcriptional regulator with XRE-family HTH domain [Janthinobacterium sp. S3T4]MBB5614670.1 transcriptional regulator with XRE-family HTH domain [Janthinobacterium sp. S3M3]